MIALACDGISTWPQAAAFSALVLSGAAVTCFFFWGLFK